MFNPPHPGESIRFGCMGGELDAEEAAALLGIQPAALEEMLAGRAPVTPNLARRMEAAGWSNAAFWLRMQAAYDAARERLRQGHQAA